MLEIFCGFVFYSRLSQTGQQADGPELGELRAFLTVTVFH